MDPVEQALSCTQLYTFWQNHAPNVLVFRLKNDSMFCATRFCRYLTPPPCLPIRPRHVPCPRLLWPLHPLADMTFPPNPSPPRRSTVARRRAHGARTSHSPRAATFRRPRRCPRQSPFDMIRTLTPLADAVVTATARRRRRGRVEMSAWRWRTVDGICGTRLFGSSSLI